MKLPTQRTRLGFFLAVLIIVEACAINPYVGQKYEGKSLRRWVHILLYYHGEESGDAELVNEALSAIRFFGADALPYLVPKLREKNESWKIEFFRFLIDPASNEKNPEWKNKLIEFLDRGKTFPFLQNSNDIRVRAADGLEVLGSKAAVAIPQIRPLLADPELAHDAIRVLQSIGPAAIPALTNQFSNPILQIRLNAMDAVMNMGTNAANVAPVFLNYLKDAEPYVRQAAIGGIFNVQSNQPDRVLSVLLTAVGDENPKVSQTAFWFMGRLGASAKTSVPVIEKYLSDPNKAGHAAVALTQILGADSEPYLLKALESDDPQIQWKVALSFCDLRRQLLRETKGGKDEFYEKFPLLKLDSPIGEKAIPRLIELARSENMKVRKNALYTLGVIGRRPDLVVRVLIENLSNTNRLIVGSSAAALGEFGTAAKDAVPKLVELSKAEIASREAPSIDFMKRYGAPSITVENLPSKFYSGAAFEALQKIDPLMAELLGNELLKTSENIQQSQ